MLLVCVCFHILGLGDQSEGFIPGEDCSSSLTSHLLLMTLHPGARHCEISTIHTDMSACIVVGKVLIRLPYCCNNMGAISL